jgi:hypothetical protein
MRPTHYMGDLIAKDFLRWPTITAMAAYFLAEAGEDFAIHPAELVDFLRLKAAEIIEEDDLDDQESLAEWLEGQ